MKKASLSIILCIIEVCAFAQPALIKEIDQTNSPSVALAPLRFLASDELMGRATMRPEIHVAARYISEQFRSFGLREAPGGRDYFQTFDLKFVSPAVSGSLKIGNKTYLLGDNLLKANGADISETAPVVFAGFGTAGDLVNLDVKGKIVITNMGESDSSPVIGGWIFREAKAKLMREKGALALVERYWHKTADWELIKPAYQKERPVESDDNLMPVLLVHDEEKMLLPAIQNQTTATLNVTGCQMKNVQAKNVMGWVQGTDAALNKQFIVLSAHYDHIGVNSEPKMEEGKLDSIYNGARDNAVGVTAMINAARYFAAHPPKRSVLFIAYTAEEMGLLGSRHFATHPTIPLNKIVYNLNIDNGGYNDTTRISISGMGRTTADEDIRRGCSAFGLTALADLPGFDAFDKSDNVSLAVKGVPAPIFGLGITRIDESIIKRLHQLSDEVGNMNERYALKYIKAYILSAKYIADNPKQPKWTAGDKYEAAWKELYRKNKMD